MKPLRLARTWLRTPRKALYIYVSPAPATEGAQTTPKTRRLGRPDASHKVPPFPAVAGSRSSERYSCAVLCPSLPSGHPLTGVRILALACIFALFTRPRSQKLTARGNISEQMTATLGPQLPGRCLCRMTTDLRSA